MHVFLKMHSGREGRGGRIEQNNTHNLRFYMYIGKRDNNKCNQIHWMWGFTRFYRIKMRIWMETNIKHVVVLSFTVRLCFHINRFLHASALVFYMLFTFIVTWFFAEGVDFLFYTQSNRLEFAFYRKAFCFFRSFFFHSSLSCASRVLHSWIKMKENSFTAIHCV